MGPGTMGCFPASAWIPSRKGLLFDCVNIPFRLLQLLTRIPAARDNRRMFTRIFSNNGKRDQLVNKNFLRSKEDQRKEVKSFLWHHRSKQAQTRIKKCKIKSQREKLWKIASWTKEKKKHSSEVPKSLVEAKRRISPQQPQGAAGRRNVSGSKRNSGSRLKESRGGTSATNEEDWKQVRVFSGVCPAWPT